MDEPLSSALPQPPDTLADFRTDDASLSVSGGIAEADALLARRITRPSPWDPGLPDFQRTSSFPVNF